LILLAKLYRKKIDNAHHRTYRTFILKEDIQERARVARSDRGRYARRAGALGRHFNLDVLFDELNGKYFAGAMEKPELSWSAKKARSILGRYDATHRTIYISRLFDAPAVPPYVIEYVMFHEMLHMRHQSQVQQSRLIVHTPEFKSDERKFPHYKEAKLWLKQI
jgi:predicted metal-dependent hydrolase